MLILPLHRPLTRATFPLVTALLMFANVFVYLVFQVPDGAALARAQSNYMESGLAALEAPAYEKWLQREGRAKPLAELRSAPEDGKALAMASLALTDEAIPRALADASLFDTPEDFARWRQLRPRYDELRAQVFTLRHLLRSSEIDPWRMLSAAFLHGDPMHLVGNMVFLAALGLLVEGALGPGRFLAVYLLGAFGSSAVLLWWRWGESGGGLGASGAIAALMGAFCVVWGRQPVRFFYWFGVVFDYVRAPAIWLLPAWLGWELYNLAARPELGIGFDAHAGGLVCGALLGAALVAARQVRRDFIVDPPADAGPDTRYARALQHLGRMELAEADALLVALQQETPRSFDVALARYRVARNGRVAAARAQRALELLRLDAPDGAAAREQAAVLAQETELPFDGSQRQRLARRWTAFGQADAAQAMLLAAPEHEALPQAVFELALHRERERESQAAQALFETVARRWPGHPLASKAKFLLDNR